MEEQPVQIPQSTVNVSAPANAVKSADTTNKTSLQIFYYYFLIPAVLIVPIWTAIGRGLFGAGGWGILFTFFYLAPIVLIYHFALCILAMIKFSNRRAFDKTSSLFMTIYYLSIFLFQISLVDGGDTKESVGSAISMLGGNSQFLESTSTFLSMLSLLLVVVFGIATLISIAKYKNKMIAN